MQIVIEHRGMQREVDLVIEGPGACVADLVSAAGGGVGEAGVAIEGRFFGLDAGLDEIGLHEGALVRITSEPPGHPALPRGPVLAIVDGPAAGGMFALDADELLVGRGTDCDLKLDDRTLSHHHARLSRKGDGRFAVVDLRSLNGTWVDGEAVSTPVVVRPGALLRMGATYARLLTHLPDDRPLAVDPLQRATGGLVPFNRPPRPALPEEVPPVELPEAPREPGGARALSIVSIVVPLLIGLILVAATGDIRFALFILLSPIMAIGNWLAMRRGAKKEERTKSREFRKALGDLDPRRRCA